MTCLNSSAEELNTSGCSGDIGSIDVTVDGALTGTGSGNNAAPAHPQTKTIMISLERIGDG